MPDAKTISGEQLFQVGQQDFGDHPMHLAFDTAGQNVLLDFVDKGEQAKAKLATFMGKTPDDASVQVARNNLNRFQADLIWQTDELVENKINSGENLHTHLSLLSHLQPENVQGKTARAVIDGMVAALELPKIMGENELKMKLPALLSSIELTGEKKGRV